MEKTPRLTSMVSLAASSSKLTPLLSLGVSLAIISTEAGVPSPPCPSPEVKEASPSSPPARRAGVPVEDCEAEECCLKGTRGIGGSIAWLHSRNLRYSHMTCNNDMALLAALLQGVFASSYNMHVARTTSVHYMQQMLHLARVSAMA